MRGSLTLGEPGHLTKVQDNLIHQHFNAILRILTQAGMDRVHIFEYVMSLGHSWWMDSL